MRLPNHNTPMPRPIHFEIHADDPARAAKFYTDLFGWKFTEFPGGPMPYWLISTGPEGTPGIDGGMHPRMGPKPVPEQAVTAYVCTIDVPDIDAYLAKVTALGRPICVPKMPIPGIGWLAYAIDSEGNIFGLMQQDAAAK